MSTQVKQVVEERSESFEPAPDYPDEPTADLSRFYGPLDNYVRMVTRGYSNLLLLDAAGGLGKTYNVKRVLREEVSDDAWTHVKGFTTPLELYKTLYMAQGSDHILFLDDMSGLSSSTKALDMLKAATDTEGEENWIEYRTSRDIDHPSMAGHTIPNTFCFRGRIIMSFNDTPDKPHFNALRDRGTDYALDFSYDERIDLITEIAKLRDFSPLSVSEQMETADWVATVTDPSIEVSIRTFENVCQMRHYGQTEGEDWEHMALEVFDLDFERYLIVDLMETDAPVMQQIEQFKKKTGRSQGHYYNLKNQIMAQRMS
jgi:hypothetical protein